MNAKSWNPNQKMHGFCSTRKRMKHYEAKNDDQAKKLYDYVCTTLCEYVHVEFSNIIRICACTIFQDVIYPPIGYMADNLVMVHAERHVSMYRLFARNAENCGNCEKCNDYDKLLNMDSTAFDWFHSSS